MTRNEIMEKLQVVFRYTVTNADQLLPTITEQSDLYTDIGLTSVGLLYIVIAMEEIFHISFDNVSFGDFRTVKDVVDYLEKKYSE